MTSTASANRRACCRPFWPVVASMVSSTSCGAPSSLLADHAVDLAQLLHQVVLGVQPPGGIDDDHVAAAGLGRGHRVEGHRGRVGTRLAMTRSRPRPARAHVSSCSPAAARKVSAAPITQVRPASRRCQAILPIEVVLPVPLTPVIEHHGRPLRHVDAGVALGRHQLCNDLAQPRRQLCCRGQPAGVGLGLQPLDHRHRGRHAAVGRDQRLLQPLPHVSVGRVEHDPGQLLGSSPAGCVRSSRAAAPTCRRDGPSGSGSVGSASPVLNIACQVRVIGAAS